MRRRLLFLSILLGSTAYSWAADTTQPQWMDSSKSPSQRARLLLNAMGQDEKLHLISSEYAMGMGDVAKPKGAIGSAAFIAGITRLRVPALQITDGGLGIANPGDVRPGDGATALPSGQVITGAFDRELTRQVGWMVGTEARHRGMNVLLAGSMNLVRDPRGGRNYEYLGEDPVLSGETAAALVQGAQSAHVISTIKHFALNNYETGRLRVDMNLRPAAMQESDLLAFKIAIEHGHPGSVMCAYNQVNHAYSCENRYLLTDVLRQQWQYPGFVMSDWGAVRHGARAVAAGLDQESAAEFDREAKPRFIDLFRQNVSHSKQYARELNTHAQRILYAMFSNGLFDHTDIPTETKTDIASHMAIVRRMEEEGAVLLRNVNHTLPLALNLGRILVVGGHADKGVLAGGGPSAVVPRGGSAIVDPIPMTLENMPHPMIYDPDPPFRALQVVLPKAAISYLDGADISAAERAAKDADAVIVFVTKWQGEGLDAKDLTISAHQNDLVSRIAKSNHRVIVVLETGNPVQMPWFEHVGAVLEAWYPGSAGGQAIANLLSGKVNPSGRLTTTWPVSLDSLPRPYLRGAGTTAGSVPPVDANQNYAKTIDLNIEGANVGYRWFLSQKTEPLFPFGYGLSFTQFAHEKIEVVQREGRLFATVTLHNVGSSAGDDVAQIYVESPDGSPRRLAGFARVSLMPGERKVVEIPLTAEVLLRFDAERQRFWRPAGDFRFVFARDSMQVDAPSQTLRLTAE